MLNSPPAHLEDLSAAPGELLLDALRLRRQCRQVDANAGALDVGQDRNQRQLERDVHIVQLFLFQAVLEKRSELSGDVGALARVIDGRLNRHVGQRQGFGAAAAHLFLRERLVARMLERQIFQPVRRPGGVDEITANHRVGVEAAQRDAVPGEHDHVEFHVVPYFRDAIVFERRLQRGERRLQRQRAVVAERAVAGGHVVCLPRSRRERQADDRSGHRRRPVGQHTEGEPAARRQPLGERADILRRVDDPVCLLNRARGGCVFGNQCPERQGVEDLEAPLAGGARVAKRIGVELYGHIRPDARELPALPRRLDVGEERFAIALLRDLRGVRNQVLERSVL